MTVAPETLDRVLGTVEVHGSHARRRAIRAGLEHQSGSATSLVHVLSGSVRMLPYRGLVCHLDVERGAGVTAVPEPSDGLLREGDALLRLVAQPLTLRAQTDAELLVVDLGLGDESALGSLFPGALIVRDFRALEPAAAALAANMDTADPAVCLTRAGDLLVCRTMVQALLLSVIPAWAENGCAPEGWPGVSQDPFLERVVDAIHAEPGRDWTVESLASVAAMSRSVFAERFRSVLGHSPAGYVTEVRLRAAKRMLTAGRSVSETSRELGYASDEGFSRAFRRHVGMPPSAWRAAERAAVPA